MTDRLTVGYARLSKADPKGQQDESHSVALQASKIASYCDIKDWTLAEVIKDDGESAKSLQREGMQRLITSIESGAIETVIVYKLDRLTRSLRDLSLLMDLFQRHNVALVSLQESIDATTAGGRLMMNLVMSISQWEREVIGERTRDALQHLKANGQAYCGPMMTDEATIAKILDLHKSGAADNAIAKALNREKITTARGGRWHHRTIKLIRERHG